MRRPQKDSRKSNAPYRMGKMMESAFVRSACRLLLCSGLLVTGAWSGIVAEEAVPVAVRVGAQFTAQDTLRPATTPADAQQLECLAGLCWEPERFEVTLEEGTGEADFLVRFPSPITSPQPRNNRVALEWYRPEAAAADSADQAVSAPLPAVVVVHESGRGMTVGKLFARSFRKAGYHAFLLHLPSYGARSWGATPQADELMVLLRQGIADVRRARDAVAALPGVDTNSICLQGTSLGGIVSATVAGIDQQYAAVFLLLAGGDLPSLIQEGQRDAAKLRQQLEQAQLTEQSVRQLVDQIDPIRLASRIAADRVWLYSGKYDTVVPMKNAEILARTAGLPREHHIVMPVDHYLGILFFPVVMKHMDQQIQLLSESTE